MLISVMRLPHAVAFPLEWRTDSVANASAHLEGPELVLTCHVLQGKPGNRKSNRKVTSIGKLFSMKTGLLCACHFNGLDQKWPRKTQLRFLYFFFSLHFTHSTVFLHSVLCTFLISFPPTFLKSTFLSSTAVLSHIFHLFTPSSSCIPHKRS